MTRDEAKADILAIGRTCRGPLVFSPEQRKVFEDRGNAALQSYDFGAAHLLKRELEITLKMEDKFVNDIGELTQRLVFLIFCHTDNIGKPCGYDYNQFVINGPWDGQRHETKCPQCGLEDFYIAPIYETTD